MCRVGTTTRFYEIPCIYLITYEEKKQPVHELQITSAILPIVQEMARGRKYMREVNVNISLGGYCVSCRSGEFSLAHVDLVK